MAQDQLSADLENLLERYRERLSQVRLDVQGLETRAPPEAPPPAPVLKDAGLLPERTFVPAWRRALSSFKPAARWGAVAAAAAFALFWRLGPLAPGPFHRSFPLPYNDTAGLAFKDQRLFSVDRARQLLFSVGAEDGQVKDVSVFTNPALDSLTWGDGYFWSTDAGGGAIYQHDNDANHTVRHVFVNPNQSPAAVFWDGWHLWARDLRTDTLSQYAVNDTLVPVKQYTLQGVSFGGMQISGNVLWVCERYRHKVRRYQLGESLSAVDGADLDPWLPQKSAVAGCAATPAALWIATTNPAEMHRFDLNRIPWKSYSSGLLKQ